MSADDDVFDVFMAFVVLILAIALVLCSNFYYNVCLSCAQSSSNHGVNWRRSLFSTITIASVITFTSFFGHIVTLFLKSIFDVTSSEDSDYNAGLLDIFDGLFYLVGQLGILYVFMKRIDITFSLESNLKLEQFGPSKKTMYCLKISLFIVFVASCMIAIFDVIEQFGRLTVVIEIIDTICAFSFIILWFGLYILMYLVFNKRIVQVMSHKTSQIESFNIDININRDHDHNISSSSGGAEDVEMHGQKDFVVIEITSIDLLIRLCTCIVIDFLSTIISWVLVAVCSVTIGNSNSDNDNNDDNDDTEIGLIFSRIDCLIHMFTVYFMFNFSLKYYNICCCMNKNNNNNNSDNNNNNSGVSLHKCLKNRFIKKLVNLRIKNIKEIKNKSVKLDDYDSKLKLARVDLNENRKTEDNDDKDNDDDVEDRSDYKAQRVKFQEQYKRLLYDN